MKHSIFFYFIIPICLLSFVNQNREIQYSAFDYPKQRLLVFKINNFDTTSYYIPDNSWLSNIGDTLFIEAIYKRSNNKDRVISYNQFNPPLMNIIKSNSYILKKIDYKSLSIRVSKYVGIRVFDAEYKLTNTNYEGYHSIDSFIDFERKHSRLIVEKIERVDKIKNW